MNQEIINLLCQREAGKSVLRALSELLDRDAYLLEIDANERSIAHRFALHLQATLPNFNVDCEYNRDGVEPKRIQHFYLNPDIEDTEAKTVFPDVIAHIRGRGGRNYLVAELKKDTNSVDREFDFAKLRGYKRDLGYEHALFIEFKTGGEPGVSKVEWIDA